MKRNLPLTVMQLVFAVAVSAAALCVNVPVSRAFEHGPWCAVVNVGSNVIWDCRYNSFEECVSNVLSGDRGSCNLNPAFGLYVFSENPLVMTIRN
jgi:hypothetical protein